MRVLLAFDKFKDALSAGDTCAIAANALRESHPDWETDCCPLTDGGEGFVHILTRAANGSTRIFPVAGPRGNRVNASLGLVPLGNIPAAARTYLDLPDTPGDALIAVIEMASASGLALLPLDRRDPWQTTTVGTGALMLAAKEIGVAAILLGVGGSATNDLGLGALSALGLEFFSSINEKIPSASPAEWENIARIGGNVSAALPPIRIACDVSNPLLGPRGAAAVYGPQKGLRPTDLPKLERASVRLARMLCAHCHQPESLMDAPGAGAAGGIAFGLLTAARAVLVPGFNLVAEWLDLDARISTANLVLTGEGRFDESSLHGKGPGAVVARARSAGRTIHVFAGNVAADVGKHAWLHAISPPELPLENALRTTPELLRNAIQQQFP